MQKVEYEFFDNGTVKVKIQKASRNVKKSGKRREKPGFSKKDEDVTYLPLWSGTEKRKRVPLVL